MSDHKRTYGVYQPLRKALTRSGFAKAGALATLLLECFFEDDGRLQSTKVIAREICEDGKFSNWRDEMVKAGWISWSHSQLDKGKYHPGKRLIPYINKEKMTSRELATKDEVASKSELQDLKERMSRIEETVQELKKSMEPPETEEKRRTRERAADRLTLLTKTH